MVWLVALLSPQGNRYLMTGKKRPRNKTSNYIISMDRTDMERHSRNCLGKLRCAQCKGGRRGVAVPADPSLMPHLCAGPTLWAPSSPRTTTASTRRTWTRSRWPPPSPSSARSSRSSSTCVPPETGPSAPLAPTSHSPLSSPVLYRAQQSNVLGTRGPRKMKVCVPRVEKGGKRKLWRPLRHNEEMGAHYKRQEMDDLVFMINKPPQWNKSASEAALWEGRGTQLTTPLSPLPSAANAYVLNFHNRVTMASVKNFQLVTPSDRTRAPCLFSACPLSLTHTCVTPSPMVQTRACCCSSGARTRTCSPWTSSTLCHPCKVGAALPSLPGSPAASFLTPPPPCPLRSLRHLPEQLRLQASVRVVGRRLP